MSDDGQPCEALGQFLLCTVYALEIAQLTCLLAAIAQPRAKQTSTQR